MSLMDENFMREFARRFRPFQDADGQWQFEDLTPSVGRSSGIFGNPFLQILPAIARYDRPLIERKRPMINREPLEMIPRSSTLEPPATTQGEQPERAFLERLSPEDGQSGHAPLDHARPPTSKNESLIMRDGGFSAQQTLAKGGDLQTALQESGWAGAREVFENIYDRMTGKRGSPTEPNNKKVDSKESTLPNTALPPAYEIKDRGVVIPDKIKTRLNAAAFDFRDSTGSVLTVTSGVRTPESQAEAMYNNYADGTSPRYGAAGAAIKSVYDAGRLEGKSKVETVNAMSDVIKDQIENDVYISRHLQERGADVRIHNLTPAQRAAMQAAIERQGGTAVFEGDHIHAQFPDLPLRGMQR